jgi:predicted XRE-type DNA-binding protein
LEDHRISAKSIAEQLGISRERVGSIIDEDLDMQKVTKGVLFLHNNAPAHQALATQRKMAYLGFQ